MSSEGADRYFGEPLKPDHAKVAFRLDANEYNGKTTVQLMVEHAEPA